MCMADMGSPLNSHQDRPADSNPLCQNDDLHVFWCSFGGCFDGCSLPTFLLLAASHCNLKLAFIYM